MASSIQLLRSTIAQERPFPANLLEGQPAVNLNSSEPGLFFKTADGSLVKFGPAAVTSDGSPPNSSPQGLSGNTVGELWLDKSTDPAVLKVYDGTAWVDAGSGGGGGGGGSGAYVRWQYTAVGGETSLSGSSGGVVLSYTPELEEVFLNGVLLKRGVDYSAVNGSSVTNLAALQSGDEVTVLSIIPLETVQLPGQVTITRWSGIATAGQTTISGVDTSGVTLAYTPGLEEVYINGVFLRRDLDYTATNGASIIVNTALALDDEISVVSLSPFEVAGVIQSNDVSFQQDDTGSQPRTVKDKLSETLNVFDFIPSQYHDSIVSGTAVFDCRNSIEAAIDALIARGGGDLIMPAGTYPVSSSVTTYGSENTKGVRILAYGAILEKTPTTVAYSMFYPGSNTTVEGLTLRGYVDSGTYWEDVVPAWSFGFRVQSYGPGGTIPTKNVKFISCNVENIPYDGWFTTGSCEDIAIINCTGSINEECYRNTIAIAPSGPGSYNKNVLISGGKFGPAKGRPAIDLEPDGGGILFSTTIRDCSVTGIIDVIAGTREAVLEGITFDGPNSYLNTDLNNNLTLNGCSFINGAYIRKIGGLDQGATPVGDGAFRGSTDLDLGSLFFDTPQQEIGPNEVKASYNSINPSFWSFYTAGPGTGTVTPNVPFGPFNGIEINAVDKAITYSQTILDISPDTYYSFGGYHQQQTAFGFGSVVLIEEDSLGNILTYYVFEGNKVSSKFNFVWKTNSITDRVRFRVGSQNFQSNILRYGGFYLRKGITTEWVPHVSERSGPLWNAPPTTGEWYVGDVVYNSAPAASGNIGWVCVVAGTPGTWKAFGNIAA